MVYTTGFLSGGFGWAEILILAAVGLLIFGRRLPEVGRSLGKGIVEFKKGLSGIEDDLEETTRAGADPKQIDQNTTTTVSDSSTQNVKADQPPHGNG